METNISIGRNDPCHCGSGKKYKKCCQEKDEAKERTALEKQYKEAEKKMEKTEEPKTDEKSSGGPSIHQKSQASKSGPQKHTAFVTPKYNMPRKSGGGG